MNDTKQQTLSDNIKQWGRELGFQQIGITNPDLTHADKRLTQWLDKGFHGDMEYMQRHAMRGKPQLMMPEVKSIIVARMDYLPPNANIKNVLRNPLKAFVSRYAVGRDYHKLIRKRLATLAKKIETITGPFVCRPFTDSAPVMEKPLAQKAGLGWQGKHTNLINSKAGSWFFLGVLYTSLDLALDTPASSHCGSCNACIDICPTQAIVAPNQLDARRCISYLTIELRGSIPEEFRPLLGNRVYGCDDCQLICPWNKFAKATCEKDFHPRHDLDSADLVTLFNWTEAEFLDKTQGSAIRRIGYECWLRNIAVGLGNAVTTPDVVATLREKQAHSSELVREHVQWALQQHM